MCPTLGHDIEVRNVLSTTYQKQKSRAEAFEQWAKEWHAKPRNTQPTTCPSSNLRTDTTTPCGKQHLKISLPDPPSVQLCVLLLAMPLQRNIQGGSRRILNPSTLSASAAMKSALLHTLYLTAHCSQGRAKMPKSTTAAFGPLCGTCSPPWTVPASFTSS
ncbi:hypothetical protein EI94DRAFT_500260 [Lactarius quietus]|nr:hypothetical protein EI94DRAFT_500260 [Lactarius quietus]